MLPRDRAVLRFHFDESVPTAAATGLRQRGIDLTLPEEVGLLGASDSEQLEFAVSSNRVLVTEDSDFLALVKRDAAHCGVAYCRHGRLSVGQLIRALELMAQCYEDDGMQGRIEFLEPLGNI